MPSRPDLSSEILLKNRSDLRFCCAICAADPDIARQFVESRKGTIDWMALIELAKNYRLEMVLYRAVNSRFIEFVSSSALEALHKLYADNRARGLALTATLLHLLGIDHERFTVKFQGLEQRLSGVESPKVIQELLA